MTIRHSISWWCFESLMPPEKLISTAVELGFDGLELVGQQHWDTIRDAGLEIAAVVGHESLGEIIENLKLTEKYSIRRLICFSGNRHGESDERGIDVTAAGLRRVAKAAEEADVYLVLELLNSKVNHAGYQCDLTEWGVEVVNRVASPRVKLLYDIYHMQIMEGDLIRTIQDNHEHFAHYHTAGNPGRNNLDETQEIYYPAVIAAIRDTGYKGYVGHEFIPVGDPVEALKKALQVCKI